MDTELSHAPVASRHASPDQDSSCAEPDLNLNRNGEIDMWLSVGHGRCGFTTSDAETGFVTFSHQSGYGRAVLLGSTLLFAMAAILREDESTNSMRHAFYSLTAVTGIVLMLSFRRVANLCSCIQRFLHDDRRALISEVFIPVFIVFALGRIVIPSRAQFYLRASEVPTSTRIRGDMTMMAANVGMAPVRMWFAAVPLTTFVVAHWVYVMTEPDAEPATDLCFLCVSVLELATSLALLLVWESQRRSSFLAHMQLTAQAAEQRRLASVLLASVDQRGAPSSCATSTAPASTLPSVVGSPRTADETHRTIVAFRMTGTVGIEAVQRCKQIIVDLAAPTRATLVSVAGSTVVVKMQSARRGCELAVVVRRTLRDTIGASEDLELRIGVDAGLVRDSEPFGDASVLVPRVMVAGRPIAAALRLADLAVAGAIVVTGACKCDVESHFAITPIRSTLVGGVPTEVHLLGAPLFCVDQAAAMLPGTYLEAGGATPALEQEQRAHDLSRSSNDPLATASGDTQMVSTLFGTLPSPVKCVWSVFPGWAFDDAEVEAAYRFNELGGKYRLVPAVLSILHATLWIGWVFAGDVSSVTAGAWVAVVFTVVGVLVLLIVAASSRTSQLRGAVLTLACFLLGTVALTYVVSTLPDDHPLVLYAISYHMIVFAFCLRWHPAGLPNFVLPVLSVALYITSCTANRLVVNVRPFVSNCVVNFLVTWAGIQVDHGRRRESFAAVANAERNARWWADARVSAYRRLAAQVPLAVARRVAKRANVGVHESDDSATAEVLKLLCNAVVLAFRVVQRCEPARGILRKACAREQRQGYKRVAFASADDVSDADALGSEWTDHAHVTDTSLPVLETYTVLMSECLTMSFDSEAFYVSGTDCLLMVSRISPRDHETADASATLLQRVCDFTNHLVDAVTALCPGLEIHVGVGVGPLEGIPLGGEGLGAYAVAGSIIDDAVAGIVRHNAAAFARSLRNAIAAHARLP
jgi:hypothetical protein